MKRKGNFLLIPLRGPKGRGGGGGGGGIDFLFHFKSKKKDISSGYVYTDVFVSPY